MFWVGYMAGVSQNIVAALLLSPFIIKWFKGHMQKHHDKIISEIRRARQ